MKRPEVVHPVNDGLLSPADLSRILALVAQGEPVALPTETVYGLAADALRAEACARIFAMKDRPFTDPLICHVADAGSAGAYAEVDEVASALMDAFWPGPLTVILPKKNVIPDLVTAGSAKVALRSSAHPLFHQIVQAWGGPLAAPSANRFGRISPTTADDVVEELGARVALIVDGGGCSLGLESTIVEPIGGSLRLLRRGPVQPEDLSRCAPVVEVSSSAADSALVEAPGRLPWHYAPATPLRLLGRGEVPAGDLSRCGLLAWDGSSAGDWRRVERLSPGLDLEEAGRKFYGALRRLDAAGLETLYAEALPETGLGRTLMERLRKAAARG